MSFERESFFCLMDFNDFSRASALSHDSFASFSKDFLRMLASLRACVNSCLSSSCFCKSSRSFALSLVFSSRAALRFSPGSSSTLFWFETSSRDRLSLSRSRSSSPFSLLIDSCSFSMTSFSAETDSNQIFSCSFSSVLRRSCASNVLFSAHTLLKRTSNASSSSSGPLSSQEFASLETGNSVPALDVSSKDLIPKEVTISKTSELFPYSEAIVDCN